MFETAGRVLLIVIIHSAESKILGRMGSIALVFGSAFSNYPLLSLGYLDLDCLSFQIKQAASKFTCKEMESGFSNCLPVATQSSRSVNRIL